MSGGYSTGMRSPWQSPLRDLYDLSGFPQRNPRGGTGGRFYNPNYAMMGVRTAPMAPDEELATGLTPDLSLAMMREGLGGIEELGRTRGGFYTGAENPFFNEVLGSSYEAMQPFINRERQKLTSMATLMGQGSGVSTPLMQTSRELSENVLNNLSAQIAPMKFGEYGRERGLQDAAMRTSLGMPGAGLDMLYRSGGLERGIAQSALDSMYQDFARMQVIQGGEEESIKSILGLLGTGASGPQTFGPSPFESILGAIMPLLLSK